MAQLTTTQIIPIAGIVLMIVAGFDIRLSDFQRAVAFPKAFALTIGNQLLLMPVIAFAIVKSGLIDGSLQTAFVVLACCPGGAISSYYVYLARGNVALSVSITTVSTLVSLLTIPFWLQIMWTAKTDVAAFTADWLPSLVLQLCVVVMIPAFVGATLAHYLPSVTVARRKIWRAFSLLVLLVIFLIACWDFRKEIPGVLLQALEGSILFVMIAVCIGIAIAKSVGPFERPVIVAESTVRNVVVALLVGKMLLNQQQFGAFAAFLSTYFALEAVVMTAYAALVQRPKKRESNGRERPR